MKLKPIISVLLLISGVSATPQSQSDFATEMIPARPLPQVRSLPEPRIPRPPMRAGMPRAAMIPPAVPVWPVFWDITPSPSLGSNGVYVIKYGPALGDLTNRIITTAGTNSAMITRPAGVRYYWAVVAVDVEDTWVESEQLVFENRLPLAYKRHHVTLTSETPTGPRVPMFTNAIPTTNVSGFFWGEIISTIIP